LCRGCNSWQFKTAKTPDFATPLAPDTNSQPPRGLPVLSRLGIFNTWFSYHQAVQHMENPKTCVCLLASQVTSQLSFTPRALDFTPSKVSPVKSWLSTTPTNLQHHTFSSTQFHRSHNSSPRVTSLSARDKSAAHHHQGTERRLSRATCHMVKR
jgi:hypothetical protein